MKEIAYLKDLPIRLVNKNHSFIRISGANLYVDRNNSRYAFIAFENLNKKPFFSINLALKQYDASGRLVRESTYYIPHLYGNHGVSVIENPIPVENECDALDVYIIFAEYPSFNFVKDSKVNARNYLEGIPSIEDKPRMPGNDKDDFVFPETSFDTKGFSSTSSDLEEKESKTDVKEETQVSETALPKEENDISSVLAEEQTDNKHSEEVSSDEENCKEETASVEEKQTEAETNETKTSTEEASFSTVKPSVNLYRIILPIVFGVVAITIFLIFMIMSRNFH